MTEHDVVMTSSTVDVMQCDAVLVLYDVMLNHFAGVGHSRAAHGSGSVLEVAVPTGSSNRDYYTHLDSGVHRYQTVLSK